MDDKPMTEEENHSLFKKLTGLLLKFEEIAEVELRSFSVEELQALQKIYGKSLAYDLYTDVTNALAEPKGTETIH
jgi:hypothetical protein|tara:strand:+ start:4407 stop:4631 length:225 start_codon:yes stop_codon:yes gene_type:complete